MVSGSISSREKLLISSCVKSLGLRLSIPSFSSRLIWIDENSRLPFFVGTSRLKRALECWRGGEGGREAGWGEREGESERVRRRKGRRQDGEREKDGTEEKRKERRRRMVGGRGEREKRNSGEGGKFVQKSGFHTEGTLGFTPP